MQRGRPKTLLDGSQDAGPGLRVKRAVAAAVLTKPLKQVRGEDGPGLNLAERDNLPAREDVGDVWAPLYIAQLQSTMSGYLEDLSDSQRAALDRFRTAIADVHGERTDRFLLRWLRAREFDVSKAEDMFRRELSGAVQDAEEVSQPSVVLLKPTGVAKDCAQQGPVNPRFTVCFTVSLIANAVCNARTLSFCIRCKFLPEGVKHLFGGFTPSAGHGVRILKILRSEWRRQARIYRTLLCAVLRDPGGLQQNNGRLRDFFGILDRTTEFLWQQSLQRLRSGMPRKHPIAACNIKSVSEVHLPEKVKQVLDRGPKFAVEPKMSAPELLGLVRRVSRHAPDGEVERCISEGVDVLTRNKPDSPGVPIRKAVSLLRERRLSLLPADKEGGFVVLTEAEYASSLLRVVQLLQRYYPGGLLECHSEGHPLLLVPMGNVDIRGFLQILPAAAILRHLAYMLECQESLKERVSLK
ncbi:hypothetical protein HPB47_006830, partial [Ixodes persulcatus]